MAHVIGYFRNQKYAVALIVNHVADQFLGPAVAIVVRCVDQRHAERNACAQRFFFNSGRVFSLRETRRALTERRDDGAIGELCGTNCPGL